MSLLVIGANGFIGRQFVAQSKRGEIYTVRRKTAGGCIHFDPSRDRLRSIPGIADITHTLLLFAEREPDRCIADPVGTRSVNVDLPCKIIDECVELGITPIFASSELVFDGKIGLYEESSLPRPILEYGRQKLETEQHLLSTVKDGLVLRFPKTFGLPQGDRSLCTSWIDKIRERPNILHCASDQFFSLQFVDDVPTIVRTIIQSRMSGIVHLGDGQRHSRFDLLSQLCATMLASGVQVPKLKRVSIHDFDLREPRPTDVSMSNARLFKVMGTIAEPIEITIEKLVRQYSGT